jgi:hypothetical protein
MIRQIAIGLALFLSPYALYWLFLWAAQPGPGKGSAWSPLALGLLTTVALLLLVGGLAVWIAYSGAPPDATYVPAHMENGRFVPGTFK